MFHQPSSIGSSSSLPSVSTAQSRETETGEETDFSFAADISKDFLPTSAARPVGVTVLSNSPSTLVASLPSNQLHDSSRKLSVDTEPHKKGTFGTIDLAPSVLIESPEAPNPRTQGNVEEERNAEDEGNLSIPSYPPPRKPLSPYQLGRIAASFGIVIPNLALPPPSPVSPTPSDDHASVKTGFIGQNSPSPLLSPYSQTTRMTGYLLSVVPPTTLLPPSKSLTPEQAKKRERKWRRGTLMPLQPTMGGMLLCIAREYGLPSTVGIHLYLILPSESPLPTSPCPTRQGTFGEPIGPAGVDDESEDEPDGPRISASTWGALFSPFLLQSAGSTSRAGTPWGTPLKKRGNGTDGESVASPLMRGKPGDPFWGRTHGHQSTLSTSTTASQSSQPQSHKKTDSSSSTLPPTPSSLALSSPHISTIAGTIEFDIDLDEAHWFENWKQKGEKRRIRKISGEEGSENGWSEGGGVKELGLVKKLESASDPKPRFLRELETQPSSPALSQPESPSPALLSPPPSTGLAQDSEKDAQVSEVVKLLSSQGVHREDLLASPIQLEWMDGAGGEGGGGMQIEAVKRVKEVLERRWSGLVMSDQLDDLERIMRQLSPREIRLTSPRYMTPRTAEKINNTLAAPSVPSQLPSGPLSPLSGEVDVELPHLDRGSESESSAYGESPESRVDPPTSNVPPVKVPEAQEEAEPTSTQPQCPPAPFRAPSTPSSPSINAYSRPSFPVPRNASSPADLPSETTKRKQADLEASSSREAVGNAWVPRRPVRPPSPQLDQVHPRTLSHTLPSEYVDILKSPPPSSASPTNRVFTSPRTDPGQGEDGKRRKSGLKVLRHQMSNVNLKWKGDREEAVPAVPGGTPGSAGLASPSEFGSFGEEQEEGREKGGSLPAKGKFTSRLFHPSFGFRRHDAQPAAHSQGHSRRQPSHDGSFHISEISSPIASTFKHTRSGSVASTLPDSATLPHYPIDRKVSTGSTPTSPVAPVMYSQTPTTPATPASPGGRSVRRKPVPSMDRERGESDGVKNSMSMGSMGSMTSFVLEDPPKGRRGLGMGMAV